MGIKKTLNGTPQTDNRIAKAKGYQFPADDLLFIRLLAVGARV
jgi:hypothetical protein